MILIDKIKNKINIIELAKSEGLLLKKQSNSIYKAKCCFHNETKASLTFYTDDPENKKPNSFFCYACQEHGDVINFYAKRHNLTNSQAIKELANQLGLQTSFKGLKRTEKTNLIAISRQKSKSISEVLMGKERQFKQDPDIIYRVLKNSCRELDQESQTYLTSESRGLTDETIKKFGIFSIKNYKKMREFLLSKFSLKDLKKLSLFSSNNRFNFTKNKIIIPVFEDGKIIALRGRYFDRGISNPDLTNARYSYPKYKSTVGVADKLFNGDILKTLKKGEMVFLAEGEFDTMILDQHGFNAVGVLGVSNYNEATIKRLNDFDLQICFDNDERGKKEAEKISRIFNSQTERLAYFETAMRDAGVKDITELFIKRAKQKNENIQS